MGYSGGMDEFELFRWVAFEILNHQKTLLITAKVTVVEI